MTLKINGTPFTSGMFVSCQFNDNVCLEGTLHVESYPRMYFCHDHPLHRHGAPSPKMWGHRYSWAFDYDLDSGTFDEGVVSVTPMLRDMKEITVSGRLAQFMSLVKSPLNLTTLLSAKVKPYDSMVDFDLSEKAGFIVARGQVTTANGTYPKAIEVRLSRLIRHISDRLAKDFSDRWHLDDRTVESIHNQLVTFQSGGLLTLEVLSGDRILEGYDSSNYSQSGGTLHKSCMNNKAGFLSLYTRNPQVSLAVLRSPRGIEARCLLWRTDSGLYADRAYYTNDWIESAMYDRVAKLGYTPIRDAEFNKKNPYVSVSLTHFDLETYPYLDNFFYLSEDGRLYAAPERHLLPLGSFKVLRTTQGQCGHFQNGIPVSEEMLPF